MKIKYINILAVIFAFCVPSYGQMSDTTRNSLADSNHLILLKSIPSEKVTIEILNIQGQIIDNHNYMLNYLYEDQKRIKAKQDSVLKVLQSEKKKDSKKRNKRRGKIK
jgi:hypothetical protein